MLLALLATTLLQTTPAAPDWEAEGRAALDARMSVEAKKGPAKNVILFIGDGMDGTTITAARIYQGQQRGETGEENVLTFESLPHTALSKTYNTDHQTPDSAGTATAILSGRKTRSGVINVDQTVPRGDCEAALGGGLETIADFAAGTGRRVGVVTTARLTHATPASLYASSADRDWESDADMPKSADACTDIARQLLERAPGLNLDVAMGGGRSNFLPAEARDPEYEKRRGGRADGRNLIEAWQESGGEFVFDDKGLRKLDTSDDAPVLGLFEPSHMAYEADRQDGSHDPSLAEMTRFAIEKLSRSDDGYFLLVEAGRIDHAHHAGNAARALQDTVELDAAVEAAIESAGLEDTLIMVTADHGHTLALQGYPRRGNPILGLVMEDDEGAETPVPAADGKPYTTLSYANGPGTLMLPDVDGGRPVLTEEEVEDVDFKQQSLIPAPSESHGGQDVIVFADGPGSWLVGGVLEQNVLYYVMEHALGAPESASDTR
ncbi:alkaline phosphatase [Parvularcula dongshanensis]|uniref:Alkaline phosphatase n=1 Tax=Parvularcula dongshanensis TaxID=1173995 RepID=A0A840I582_9PROT|nr:alkaline phosphatase [Parvularcula dongshanensis]MBB4659999.1 alkaline phosphatase [Parvularcula dongshanensis]